VDRAVVLLSGGLDSCVAAAWARARWQPHTLHVTYGQRTAARERRAANEIAAALSVPRDRRLEVSLDGLRRIGGSSLTDPARTVEHGEPDPARIPGTYVPFRNAHLLATAVSWAEVLEARRVVIGCVQQDSSGYPDCRGSFLEAFEAAVREGTRPGTDIRVEAPLLALRKSAIVSLGIRLGAPLELSWSCYTGSERACGVCESCRLRRRGFREAGVEDPIPYDGEALA
jgi:7-cyano-7-deazaguanine synthase